MAFGQASDSEFAPKDIPGKADLFLSSFARIDGVPREFHPPSKTTVSLELGPKLLEIRANFWEKRRESLSVGSLSDARSTNVGRYFDLFATSSHFGGKLVGEGEIAYSALSFSPLAASQPVMRRFGVKGQWDKAVYGAAFRSFGQGFVSLAGATVEHDRDESQLWGEYDFGLFRFRGAAGETWETNSATNDITLTRTAGTSFHLAKPNWSALFSSSYSWLGRREEWSDKTIALANGFVLVYRPAALFTIEPNVNFRQERDRVTRFKTDTQSAGLAVTYSPLRDLQVIGRASYVRDMSDDPLKDGSIVSATGGLSWGLGESSLGKQSVSLRFEYKDELRAMLPGNHQANFSGSLQIMIAGF